MALGLLNPRPNRIDNSVRKEGTAMKKAIVISVVMLSLGASAALAAGLTEWMQAERMTVAKVDHDGGRFFCAEHRRWTQVSKTDAAALSAGDIISVDGRSGEPAKVRVLRTAADEMGSPE
jgi:hypothetical protein